VDGSTSFRLVATAASSGSMTQWVMQGIRDTLARRGITLRDDVGDDAETETGVVLHLVDPAAPRAYRRRSRAVFVVGVTELPAPPDDVLRTGYPLLVRSLSNLFILLVPDGPGARDVRAWFVTLEQGCYSVAHAGDDHAFFSVIIDRLMPLATSRLVIDNEFHTDLPESLWDGDEHTEAIYQAGRRLEALDLLPAPFPIQDLLSPRDYRHVQRLFGIGGLSYGNVSTRHEGDTFWMSASGVDKSSLRTVGQEILLVKGYDAERGTILLSVPPHRPPRRVSVDAIEHLMIYREHPGVGAILHVHAWMAGVPSSQTNYPCGTVELAHEVSRLLRQTDDPSRAVIGLKNHGLTITGPDLDEIFTRIDGRILRQVPMS
jgi:hypothetical protein